MDEMRDCIVKVGIAAECVRRPVSLEKLQLVQHCFYTHRLWFCVISGSHGCGDDHRIAQPQNQSRDSKRALPSGTDLGSWKSL